VVFGYIEAPANALAYSWKHFIGGHLGRLGTRDDVTLHQQYMADIAENSRKAIDTVDPTRYFMKYGENTWAAVKGYLDEVTRAAAAPVIEKYTGVLAAADVFTESTTFWVMGVHPPRPRLRLTGASLMASLPVRDPVSDHLLTPQNAALLVIDTSRRSSQESDRSIAACCSRTSSRPSRPRRDPTRFPSCLRDRRSAVCGMARRHEPGR
jgi:hypothetical protein